MTIFAYHLCVIRGKGRGVAPGSQPVLSIRVDRHVRKHVAFSSSDEISQQFGFYLGKCTRSFVCIAAGVCACSRPCQCTKKIITTLIKWNRNYESPYTIIMVYITEFLRLYFSRHRTANTCNVYLNPPVMLVFI